MWEYKGQVQCVSWQIQITSLRMKVAKKSLVDEFYSIFFMLYLCYLQKSTERENKHIYDKYIMYTQKLTSFTVHTGILCLILVLYMQCTVKEMHISSAILIV